MVCSRTLRLIALVMACAASCKPQAPPPPLWVQVTAGTAVLRAWADELDSFPDSNASAHGRRWLTQAQQCTAVTAQAPQDAWETLPAALRCQAGGSTMPLEVRAMLGEQLAWQARSWQDGALLRVDAQVPGRFFSQQWGWLLPAGTPAPQLPTTTQPPVFAAAGVSAAASVRALLPDGVWKGRGPLTAAITGADALLDGRWRVLAWAPASTSDVPPAAIHLGVHNVALATSALAGLRDILEDKWGLQAEPWEKQDLSRAGCLGGVRLMPGLTPCYAADATGVWLTTSQWALGQVLHATGGRTPLSAVPDAVLLRLNGGAWTDADRLLGSGGGKPRPDVEVLLTAEGESVHVRARISGGGR